MPKISKQSQFIRLEKEPNGLFKDKRATSRVRCYNNHFVAFSMRASARAPHERTPLGFQFSMEN